MLLTELNHDRTSGFPHRNFFQACEDSGLAIPRGWFIPRLKSEMAVRACAGEPSAVDALSVEELRYFVKWLCFGQRHIEEGWIDVCSKGLPQAVVLRLLKDHSILPYPDPAW